MFIDRVRQLDKLPAKQFLNTLQMMYLIIFQLFESNRVKFYMQTEVSELREQEGKVTTKGDSCLFKYLLTIYLQKKRKDKTLLTLINS